MTLRAQRLALALALVLPLPLALGACDRAAAPPDPNAAAETPAPDVAAAPKPAESSRPTPTGPAKIEFETLDVNFGDVPEIEKRSTSVRFVNRGGEELVIEAVKTTCGCTAAEPRKRRYAPGEAGILDVEFDPSGSGEQEKKIKVFTNAGQVDLSVRANVIAFAELDPPILKPGTLAYGQPHRLEVRLDCADPDPVIGSVTATNPHVSMRALPPTPGAPPVIEINIAPTAEWGSLFSWLAVEVTARPQRGAEPITHVVRGRVQGQLFGRLRADPDTVRFGAVYDEPIERTIKLTSTTGMPFRVIFAEMYLDSGDLPGAGLERKQVSPDTWELIFTARGSAVPGPTRGRLLVETDVPGEESLLINLVGVTRDRFGR